MMNPLTHSPFLLAEASPEKVDTLILSIFYCHSQWL